MNLLCGLLFISISISSYASSDKDTSLIENGNFDEAYSFYIDYIKNNTKDSSAYFNLGKICLIRKDYKNAISHFEKAYNLDYDISIILNNLSIAYSLDNQPKMTLLCLLEMHSSKINPAIDFKSSEMSSFMASSYFKEYTYSKEAVSPGKNPANANELKKSLLNNGFACYPGSPSPAGSFTFKANGTFNRIDGGGYTGEDIVGTWTIKNNKLILKELGTIKYLGFGTEANNEIIKNGLGFYDRQKQWVWIKKNTIYEEIPFSSIKIDVIDILAQHNMGYSLNKYNDFGKTKIINGIIGKTIKSLWITY